MAGTAKGPLARPYIIQERRFGQEPRLHGSVLALESRKIESSRELHRERKALRAGFFLSELKLRPPEKLRQWMFARQIRTLKSDRYGEPKRAGGTPALRKPRVRLRIALCRWKSEGVNLAPG